MQEQEILEILAAHADALNEGHDTTEAMLARHPDQAAQLAPLLALARGLKQALVPVPLPAGFVERLRRELMSREQPPITVTPPGRPRAVWVGAATVGSLLSLAGLWLWRRRQEEPMLPQATT